MKPLLVTAIVCSLALTAWADEPSTKAKKQGTKLENAMQLGNFSVSLTVKDIRASKAFYEKLDFRQVGGNIGRTGSSSKTARPRLVYSRACSKRTS